MRTISSTARLVLLLAIAAHPILAQDGLRVCPVEPWPGSPVTRGAAVPEAAGGGMTGDGWDGAGAGSTALFFHVEGSTLDFTTGQRAAILDALEAWAGAVQIDFYEIARANYDSEIDLSFETGDHSAMEPQEAGDTDCPFDGSGGVLAHAGFPPGVASTCTNPMAETYSGNVHFDDAETWEQDNETGAGAYSMTYVACHEIGHSLGLVHSTAAGDVMLGSVNSTTAFAGLSSNDIANIQAGYAAGTGSVTTLEDTGVWVDRAYTGTELGLQPWPMDTFAEGVAGVPPFTTDVEVHILPGAYDEPAITITQAMILLGEGGTAVIN